MKLTLNLIVQAALRLPGRFWVYLSSVGNPDYNQYAPISDPVLKSAESLREVRDLCLAYIEDCNLGGGNWPGGIFGSGRLVLGHVSYNGRLWEGLPGDCTARGLTLDDARPARQP